MGPVAGTSPAGALGGALASGLQGMQRGAAQVEGSARVLATGDLDRAVEATVASRMGTQQLRAAAAVVRTADDTLGSLIDTLA